VQSLDVQEIETCLSHHLNVEDITAEGKAISGDSPARSLRLTHPPDASASFPPLSRGAQIPQQLELWPRIFMEKIFISSISLTKFH
jgi:hypothetical protein